MKKLIFVLVITIFAVNYLHAQTAETLTNSAIIKMVKAKLSDELIIDEINSSKVNFNMSIDSVKVLTNENVSTLVIQAMKVASEKQVQSTVHSQPSAVSGQPSATSSQPSAVSLQPSAISSQQSAVVNPQISVKNNTDTVKHIIINKETPAQPINEKPSVAIISQVQVSNPIEANRTIIVKKENPFKTEIISKISIDKSSFNINLISYVNPLQQLITLYDIQFVSLKGLAQKWNQQIKDTLEREKQIQKIIAQEEKALTDKMNGNAKVFTVEILNLKTKLTKDREYYRRLKNDMANYGKNLSAQIKNLSNENEKLINDKFSEVSKMVIKSHSSPAVNDTINTMTITKQNPDTNLVKHVSPFNVILNCYTNEINPICDTIVLWNKKALTLIHQDAKLAKQLEPLNKELQQYESQAKSVRKLNKQHISDLKKQCKSLNNERNQLADQMSDDSKKLSERVNQIKKEFSGALKDRFNEAIENIDYSYE